MAWASDGWKEMRSPRTSPGANCLKSLFARPGTDPWLQDTSGPIASAIRSTNPAVLLPALDGLAHLGLSHQAMITPAIG
jgi:hypothetical protein